MSRYSLGYEAIAARVGAAAAKDLFRMSVEGCGSSPITSARGHRCGEPLTGITGAVRYDAGRQLADHRDWLAKEFDYEVSHLDRAALGTCHLAALPSGAA